MKVMALIKIAFLAAILAAASALFGLACNKVQGQYELLFSPGWELLNLALWVFGTMLFAALAAGLVAALVRPFWATVLVFALSMMALILTWGSSLIIVASVAVCFLLSLLYAYNVTHELDQRVSFSVRPMQEGQKVLLLALALLIGVSFALGYNADAKAGGYIIPPAYEQTVMEMITRAAKSQIESQPDLEPTEKAAALQQMEQQAESFWTGLEASLQPYAQYIPFGLGALVFWLLETLLGFMAWIPPMLLGVTVSLLKAMGVVKVVTETKETRKLVL